MRLTQVSIASLRSSCDDPEMFGHRVATLCGLSGETRAIAMILAGMLCISINDTLIEFLSDGYPLHQLVFVRSAIAVTALFFVAPLFITLLAIPVLGERIGAPRITAIVVGLVGVGVMIAPGADWGGIPRWNLLLPVAAAACYSGMQVVTCKLGAHSAASAMAIHIQGTFIVVSVGFFLIAGAGLAVFTRERALARPVAAALPMRRG